MEGRGEKITKILSPPKMHAVIVVPDVPNAPEKTARMYAALKKEHFTDGKITEKLVSALHNDRLYETMLFNAFENVAYKEKFPGLEAYQQHLIKLGAKRVHLAGAGPALFTLFKEKAGAADYYKKCIDQKLNAFLDGDALNKHQDLTAAGLYKVALVHGGPGAPGSIAPVARELSKTCGVLEPLQTRASVEWTGQRAA